VKLSSLKGSVVVLDFWATWCGPCKLSLPHLNELDAQYRGKGVKVFAVDEREPKETVTQFMAANHYTFNVLMDADGAAGEAYKADSIPVTAVIGKDGNVKKLLVGFGPETPQSIQSAVEAALAEH
jgi:thiol-disulfide isomerase/thioredoxin